jgi:hypothetical protein
MPKVIDCYADGEFRANYRNRYTRWKFGKPKHNYYVKNRRAPIKILDLYDQYILENLNPGTTMAFDCAGYYLDGLVDDLCVVDLDPIVLSWYPQAHIYTDEKSVVELYHSADNFIVINTIKLRWKTFDAYTDFWCRARRFLRNGCQVFFSYRDIFIFHNRLKYNFSELSQQWLLTMEQHGFYVNKYQYEPISVTSEMHDLSQIPEINDMVNGNVKIHWQYRCT